MIFKQFIQKLNILSSKCYSLKAYPSVHSIPSTPHPPANLVSHKQLDGRIDSVSYLVVKINSSHAVRHIIGAYVINSQRRSPIYWRSVYHMHSAR